MAFDISSMALPHLDALDALGRLGLKGLGEAYLTTICFMRLVGRLTEIFSNFFPESISSYINLGMYEGKWWGITLSLLVLLVFY